MTSQPTLFIEAEPKKKETEIVDGEIVAEGYNDEPEETEPETTTPKTGTGNAFEDLILDVVKKRFKPDLDLKKINKMMEKKIEQLQKIKSKTIEIKNIDTGKIIDLGIQHKAFDEILHLAQMRENVYMVGEAGSGKTTIARNIAKALEIPFYPHSCSEFTTPEDILGFTTANGETVRTKTREAYEHGGLVLWDEIDRSNANVMVTLNMLLDNGLGSFPDAVIERHPDFVCLTGANTYGKGSSRTYIGANQLDGATLERFLFVEVDYDEALEIALANDEPWTRHVQLLRRAMNELHEKVIISPRASIKGARLRKTGKYTDEQIEHRVIWKGTNPEVINRIKAHAASLI